MNKNSSNVNLQITAKSWIKETDDLFDFESDSMNTSEFKLNCGDNNHFIVLHDDKILLTKDLNEVKKKVLEKNCSKILGEIVCNQNGSFQVYNPFQSTKLQIFDKLYLDRLWMVLQKNDPKLVEEGDIIKLGRVRLKIDKIVIKQNINYETNYQNVSLGINYLKTNTTQPLRNFNTNINMNNNLQYLSNNFGSSSPNLNNSINDISLRNIFENIKIEKNEIKSNLEEITKIKENQYICKICFRTDSDIQDPLITPCKCSGSMGYIHYKCLKQCINVKINTKVGENYICHIWKNFECEICLAEYPKVIKYKSHIYNLVDLDISYDQYMIFDYTLYDDLKKKSFRKGIIVVRIPDIGEISIGRTQSNTIKLKDISVSRMHCFFEKKENKIYLSDKGSKFGTLIYLNKPFTLTQNCNKTKNFVNNTISLISGKNFLNFNLTRHWSFFQNFFSSSLCCKSKLTNDDEFILNFDNFEDNLKIKDNLLCNLDDSYTDYVLNLDTIIKSNDCNNDNNSFI